MEYQTDGGSGTSYTDAGEITGDAVLTQTQTKYDGDGNVIETITSDRFNTDSTTAAGALGTRSSGNEARVYYTANYYDLADRLTGSADVGTDGGSSWTLASSLSGVPSGSLETTFDITSATVCARNGGCPTRHSYNTAPMLYVSDAVVSSRIFPRACSGDM